MMMPIDHEGERSSDALANLTSEQYFHLKTY